jgi:hypothetical protein
LSKWFQTRKFIWEFPIGSYVKLSSAVAEKGMIYMKILKKGGVGREKGGGGNEIHAPSACAVYI